MPAQNASIYPGNASSKEKCLLSVCLPTHIHYSVQSLAPRLAIHPPTSLTHPLFFPDFIASRSHKPSSQPNSTSQNTPYSCILRCPETPSGRNSLGQDNPGHRRPGNIFPRQSSFSCPLVSHPKAKRHTQSILSTPLPFPPFARYVGVRVTTRSHSMHVKVAF